MEMWCTELQDERELLEAAPIDELYTAPAQDMGTTETYHAPLCSTDEDDSYGLDSDEHGQRV
eukprot:6609172-Pyramimonas_sp.AAC.1